MGRHAPFDDQNPETLLDEKERALFVQSRLGFGHRPGRVPPHFWLHVMSEASYLYGCNDVGTSNSYWMIAKNGG